MFKKARRAKESVQATAVLVEAAAADDNDKLMMILSGRGGLDDQMLGRALVGLIGYASEYAAVQQGLRSAADQAPDYAQIPFRSAIRCVEVGSASTFNGDNLQGQQLLMATLAKLIAKDPIALRELRQVAKLT